MNTGLSYQCPLLLKLMAMEVYGSFDKCGYEKICQFVYLQKLNLRMVTATHVSQIVYFSYGLFFLIVHNRSGFQFVDISTTRSPLTIGLDTSKNQRYVPFDGNKKVSGLSALGMYLSVIRFGYFFFGTD